MRILLTNDDGIYAPGIAAMRSHLAEMGQVTVVAPDAERSAVAHSITIDRPLRVREVYVGDSFLGFGVDGSPADCVKVGVKEILKGAPDIVVSGINLGSNVGISVLYSGTVAAALEGAILGVTSVAISLAASRKPDFADAAVVACEVVKQILSHAPERGSLFNVNIPNRTATPIAGVKFAAQSTVSYDDTFDVRTDPRGGKYFWMTGELYNERVRPDSDVALLSAGYVTVTPMQYDLTDTTALANAAKWGITLPRKP